MLLRCRKEQRNVIHKKGKVLMNRKITAMLAALVLAAAFTGCGAKNDNETVQEDTAITEASQAAAETEIASETEASADTESETEADTEDAPEDVLIDDDADISADDEFPEDDVPEEEIEGVVDAASDNPLYPVIETITSQTEWPFLAEVTDDVILKEFFLLDPENSNYNRMIVMQCPMSATMSEIIIIDAVDAEAAKADLDARRTKAIEVDAWYPNDQELAAASIVGSTGNYAYFIIGQSAAEAETILVDAVNAL